MCYMYLCIALPFYMPKFYHLYNFIIVIILLHCNGMRIKVDRLCKDIAKFPEWYVFNNCVVY